MTESATNSARERRRAETTRTLVSLTRRATAEQGLAGFTIDEVCAQAGVSRRTFFNYFASKEDAVLGIPLGMDTADDDDFFVAMRPRTRAGSVSATLVEDYVALLGGRWAKLEIDSASAAELMAAATREPQLLPHMLERGRLDQQKDVALIARREGLADGDPRAVVCVQVVVHLAHLAVQTALERDDPTAFVDVLRSLVATAHTLFGDPPLPTRSTPPTGSSR